MRTRANPNLRPPLQRILQLLALIITCAAVAAGCGSSGGDPQGLLKQTFSGSHQLRSGQVGVTVTLTPSGSAILSTPIVFSLGGPFQSRGSGQLPESDFAVQITALGHHGLLNVVSTGTAGYVVLQGTGYRLPAATFHQLESSFAGLAAAGSGSSGGSSPLARLGINPLNWLQDPTLVGDETIDGTDTKHIRAGVNTQALLSDIGRLASQSSIPGASRAANLSPATLNKIAASIQSPTVDVWTGAADHTVRKLEVHLTVPVTGAISSELGGLKSVGVDFTTTYSQINQPQTIQAPAKLGPFSQFQARVNAIVGQLRSALRLLGGGPVSGTSGSSSGSFFGSGSSGTSGSATGGSGSATAGASGSSTTAAPPRYQQCIIKSHGDVTKMQACASLLGSGG